MKNIILTILFSLTLSADYLVVSSNPIGAVEDNVTRIDNFISNFNLSSSTQTRDFPLYLSSNSTQDVRLSISNFANNLSNGVDSVGLKIYYKDASSSSYNEIQDSSDILLQGAKDGQNSVGSLRIEVNGISNEQTSGNYSLSNSSIRVISGDLQASASFQVNANAQLVAVAKLGSPISATTTGSKFISSTVNFNDFSFNVNSAEQPLYVMSNSNNQFRITFSNIPDLKREGVGSGPDIVMKYYFNSSRISSGDTFVAVNGKNSGTSPIGSIRFETEEITASHIAGEYSASISVSVSAQ